MTDFFQYVAKIELLCDYILQFEDRDFFEREYASEDHIYYIAALVRHGKETADKLLDSAKSGERPTK